MATPTLEPDWCGRCLLAQEHVDADGACDRFALWSTDDE